MQTFGVNKVYYGRCASGEFSVFKGVKTVLREKPETWQLRYYFEMRKSFTFLRVPL